MTHRPRRHRDPLTWGMVALVVLAGVALAWGRAQVVFQADSPYGAVRVTERRDGVRELYLGAGRARQTAMNPDRPTELELPYTRVMLAALATVPDSGRVLFVGLGGGALPSWLRAVRPAVRIEVVEINPVVARAAREWFGFRTDANMTLHLADGRDFMEAAPAGRWDAVVLDAFSDTEIPEALTTRGFLADVRRVLSPGGVAAANLHTGAGAYRSMVATYREVFTETAILPVPTRRQVILLAAGEAEALSREAMIRAARGLARVAPAAADLPRQIREEMREAEAR